MSVCSVALLLLAAIEPSPQAASPAQRIWIVPFDNLSSAASPLLPDRGAALSELLAVFFSHAPSYAVVERRAVEQLLAEHALVAAGLIADERRNVGQLLGASHVVTGSLFLQHSDCISTALVTEIATGRIVASAQARGPAEQAAELARELYCSLDAQLSGPTPERSLGPTESAPVANLHFLHGLNSYYAARYNHAMAEFLQARSEPSLADLSRLWAGRCHLAAGRAAQAHLELMPLHLERLTPFDRDLAATERERCLAQLSSAELRLCQQLLAK